MPVVVVAAPALAADADLTEALGAVAAAVAAPLGLRPSDVVVSHAPLGAAVVGSATAPAWPVVTLHGSRRDPAAMRAAAAAAARVVASAWSTTPEETWVHWLVPADLS
jgi:hypothetical protein